MLPEGYLKRTLNDARWSWAALATLALRFALGWLSVRRLEAAVAEA